MPRRSPLAVVVMAVAALLLAACGSDGGSPAAPDGSAATAPLPELEIASGEYTLGEATIVQDSLPAGNRFREMPVRLNGFVAAPTGGGPYPVAVILHGTHPGCPTDANGVDSWPCDASVEQANYRGLSWLAESLAVRGYVAVSININAENTFGFGEVPLNTRLPRIVDEHLTALAAANDGGEAFGIPLAGLADVSRIGLVGHSRGGESAVVLARQWQENPGGRDYGPASALVLLAPAIVASDTPGPLPVPGGMLLPGCDGDVVDQDGQSFYEAGRLSQQAWAASMWLEGANHNNINTELQAEGAPSDRPDCADPLDPQQQRDVTGAYTVDVLTTVFGDEAVARGAMQRMGIDVSLPAAAELYGVPAESSYLPPADDRVSLMVPTSADQLQGQGATTTYCPEGYYVPAVDPIAGPCRRAVLVVPGQPAHGIATWTSDGGELILPVPGADADLSGYTAVSIRTAVDPLSPENAPGEPQSFSVRLTDGAGKSQAVAVGKDQPALEYPAGESAPSEFFDGDAFTGRAPLMPVRVQLADFKDVDLTDIREVAVVFDQTSTGSLFLADADVVVAAVP